MVPAHEIRRRPGDVVRLLLAATVVFLTARDADRVTAWEERLYNLLAGVPQWLHSGCEWAFNAGTIGAAAVVLVALLLTKRIVLSLRLALAGIVAWLLAVGLESLVDASAVRTSAGLDSGPGVPQYHLTRAERAILVRHATDIALAANADTLVELGSGASEKTRHLLDAMTTVGSLERFVPFDVSEEALLTAAADIASDYGIEVNAVVGDFHQHLDAIPRGGRRLVAFLGSTMGNLTPRERRCFFADLDCTMDYEDRLLLGTDLVKPVVRLLAAYDDSRGITAAFNRNVLEVLNRELGADFDPDAFDHVARWNAPDRWMEMRLRSRRRQTVMVKDLDLHVSFEEGEEMRTEISAKFLRGQVEDELWQAGFVVEKTWTDPANDFLLTLARPYC